MLPVLNDSLLRTSRNRPCCWLAICTACCTVKVLAPPLSRLGNISITPDEMATNRKISLFWSRKKSTLYHENDLRKRAESRDYNMDGKFQLWGDCYNS